MSRRHCKMGFIVHLGLNNFIHFKTIFHSSLPKLKNDFISFKMDEYESIEPIRELAQLIGLSR